MRWLPPVAALCLACCSLDNEVGQSGEYTFLPRPDINDSAPRPLRHLLIVEEDAPNRAVLVYLFSGDLIDADLGLTDLRRIAAYHNGARMGFPPERASYLLDDLPERLAEDSDFEGEVLQVRTAEDAFHDVFELNSDQLAPTGARRYLRSLDSRDFDVRAFFGHFPLGDRLVGLELNLEDNNLVLDSRLRPAALAPEAGEEALRLPARERPGADYLIVEPYQRIVDSAGDAADADAGVDAGLIGVDAAADAGDAMADAGSGLPAGDEPRAIEATVTTTLAPDQPYIAGAALLQDVAGRGCWSPDKPLQLRLTQVARDYRIEARGDWAVIHRRIDAVAVDPELWTPLIEDAQPAAYCDDFE